MRHKCRALLISREAELRRVQEQLHQMHRPSQPSPLRSHTPASLKYEPANALTEEGLRAMAAQQSVLSAEVERWRGRSTSLEARLKGATEARRVWALREAELMEALEEKDRLLQAGRHPCSPLPRTRLCSHASHVSTKSRYSQPSTRTRIFSHGSPHMALFTCLHDSFHLTLLMILLTCLCSHDATRIALSIHMTLLK